MNCPTCGAGSNVILLPELAAMFDDGRTRTRQSLVERGVRLAAGLGVTVHRTDGTRWVLRADVERAITGEAAA